MNSLKENFEFEKRSMQETHTKALEEKTDEINELKRSEELLNQDKKALVKVNESLQQEFYKIQQELTITVNFLFIFKRIIRKFV